MTMNKKNLFAILILISVNAMAQNLMSPELLWKLGRVTVLGISKDGKNIVYKVATPSIEENKTNSKYYTIPVNGGNATEVKDSKAIVADKNVSPNGKYTVYHEEVKLERFWARITTQISINRLCKSTTHDYRHWDKWNEGKYNHVFYKENTAGAKGIDLMKDEPFDSPQKPFGGDEDYIWSPDSQSILYVCKKKSGTAYAISTDTNIYEYNLETKQTRNRTEGNAGYDITAVFPYRKPKLVADETRWL
jgi:Tol biopolymer transport system component